MRVEYQFTIFLGQSESMERFRSAVMVAGNFKKPRKIKEKRSSGMFKFKFPAKRGGFRIKFIACLAGDETETRVRISAKSCLIDRERFFDLAMDKLLIALEDACPGHLSVSAGEPVILRARVIGGQVEQSFNGRYSGASVGASFACLSAAHSAGRINGSTKTVASKRAVFLLEYSNGKQSERVLKKGSDLYTEAMAKLVE